MLGLYGIGGIVTVGLLRLSLRRASQAGAILMTANAFLQIGIYLVVLLILVKPLGGFMARVYEGQPTLLGPAARPDRAARLSRVRRPSGRGHDLEDVRDRDAALQRGRRVLRLRAATPAGRAAAQSAGLQRRDARLLLQHGDELRHQHELAGVRRRVDDELPHPDAGPGGAELRLRRDRHGDPGRAHPWIPQRQDERHRQLLGRPDPQRPLHPAAALARARDRPGVAGRGAELQRLQDGVARPGDDGDDAGEGRRRQPGARRAGAAEDRDVDRDRAEPAHGTGGIADRDQADGHQRRRLLQRQLGASVREPDAALELLRDAGDPADQRGALLHLRRRWSATPARAGRCSPP